jgi:hypothetical protein
MSGLIQVSRDLKMTHEKNRPHPSLERLENDFSEKIRPHPSLERLENESSKSREKMTYQKNRRET